MSANILDMVKGAVSDQIMGQIGGLLGQSDAKKTSSMFETATQSILGGLIQKASSPQGAQDVFRAVQDQDDSVLDKLGDLLGGGGREEDFMNSGSGILDVVFGKNQSGIVKMIAKFLGLDGSIIGKLLKLAAPIIMGVIAKHVKSKALDAVGLGSLLGEQKSFLTSAMPSGLTSSLGFGDMLGSATDAVKGAGAAVAGAASDATGAAKDASRAAYGAAEDTVQAGGSILKFLIPIVLLAGLAYLAWSILSAGAEKAGEMAGDAMDTVAEKAGDMTDAVKDAAGNTVNIGDIDWGGFDMTALNDQFTGIADGFKNVTSDNAGDLATKIKDLTGSIDGLGLDKLTGPAQSASKGIIAKFVETITNSMSGISDGGILDILKPVVDALIEKLNPFK